LGGRGRGISEFKASLVYRVSSSTSRVTQTNPISKKKQKQKQKTKQKQKNKKQNKETATKNKSLKTEIEDFRRWKDL
jgi:cell division protein FtsB